MNNIIDGAVYHLEPFLFAAYLAIPLQVVLELFRCARVVVVVERYDVTSVAGDADVIGVAVLPLPRQRQHVADVRVVFSAVEILVVSEVFQRLVHSRM